MAKIVVRLQGPFETAEGSEGGNPATRYRLVSIKGDVTVHGKDGEYRVGDLLDEDQAKGLVSDYEVNTERYTG